MDEIETHWRQVHVESHTVESQDFSQQDSAQGAFAYPNVLARTSVVVHAGKLLKQVNE